GDGPGEVPKFGVRWDFAERADGGLVCPGDADGTAESRLIILVRRFQTVAFGIVMAQVHRRRFRGPEPERETGKGFRGALSLDFRGWLLPKALHSDCDSARGIAEKRGAEGARPTHASNPGAVRVGAFLDGVRIRRNLHQLVRVPHRHLLDQLAARELVEIRERLAG